MNRLFATVLIVGLLGLSCGPALGLDDSLGPAGINAAGLPPGLTGSGVNVGILEYWFGEGEKIDATHANLTVGGNAGSGLAGPLATQAAGVINSNHPVYTGVAPGATLYGYSAETYLDYYDGAGWLVDQGATIIAHFDKLELFADLGDALDGNTLETRYVDFLARQRDVLFVIHGNDLLDVDWSDPENPLQFPIPSDAYNGLTVNWTAMTDSGRYDQVAFWNDYDYPPENNRRKPDLVAPGGHEGYPEQHPESIYTTTVGGGFENVSGARLAAAHVAGTAALLTQYGFDHSLSTNHNVLKAVLINSADKTTLDLAGLNWRQSEAFGNELIPLDDELGAGQVDAAAAYDQYAAGQYQPGLVPLVGWDLGTIFGEGAEMAYQFEEDLLGGSFLTATLVWDRRVEEEVAGEYLAAFDLNDLDIHLYDASGSGIPVTGSWSAVDNVEHLYWMVPEDGAYSLGVEFRQQNDEPSQQYALAWKATPVPEPSVLVALIGVVATSVLAYGLHRWRRGS